MSTRKCRVCNGNLFAKPLLTYKNMPAISQFLPKTESDFEKDACVDLKICQCSMCGLIQLDNDPVYYFRDVIRSGGISEGMQSFRRKQFHDFVETQNLKGKKIIEIGCGGGEYLSIMHTTEANAYGLEHMPESVETCRQNGLNVFEGFLEDECQVIENGPYDAFCMFNFLEHFDQPSVALKAIANNLTDDGVGLVEVPNSDLLVKDQSFYKFTLEHLMSFTKESLTLALETNGFEVVSCVPIRKGSPLSAIVQKRKPADFSQFEQSLVKLKQEIGDFIAHDSEKQIAIWGAGHYTFGILSKLNITNKIKYIVDSAPFKQGCFSPQTHIPIVSPSALKNDPVESIIVSAGGYSEEVASIITNSYDATMRVAVIRKNSLEIIQ